MGRLGSGLAFPLRACQVRLTMALPRHTEQMLSRAWSCLIFLFKTETRYTNKNARQMLPSYWEVVWTSPCASQGTEKCPQLATVLQSDTSGLRPVLGIVLSVGHVVPPSPKRMEIFLFSKISFQMCWNFLSVGILENLVLIVKWNGNFFQTPFFGISHPKRTADFKHFVPEQFSGSS